MFGFNVKSSAACIICIFSVNACSDKTTTASANPGGIAQSGRKTQALTVPVSVQTEREIGITTVAATRRDFTVKRKLTAKIEPDLGKEVDISSRVTGRVDKILITPGAVVKTGQPIVQISCREVSELEAQAIEANTRVINAKAQEEREKQIFAEQVHRPQALFDAESSFENARLHKDLLHSQLQRQETLYQEKIGAQKDLIMAKSAYEEACLNMHHAGQNFKREQELYKSKSVLKRTYQNAQAERLKAEKEFQVLKSKLLFLGVSAQAFENCLKTSTVAGLVTILSPRNGVVSSFEIAPGELISADVPMFKITDVSTVIVKAEIPEIDAARVSVGDYLEITTPKSKALISAKVDFISEHVDATSRTVALRAHLANPTRNFKVGMFTDVLITSHSRKTLTIPKESLQEIDGAKCIFVKTPDGFKKRDVTTGDESNKYIEIKSGLEDGEIIAVNGSLILKTELSYQRQN